MPLSSIFDWLKLWYPWRLETYPFDSWPVIWHNSLNSWTPVLIQVILIEVSLEFYSLLGNNRTSIYSMAVSSNCIHYETDISKHDLEFRARGTRTLVRGGCSFKTSRQMKSLDTMMTPLSIYLSTTLQCSTWYLTKLDYVFRICPWALGDVFGWQHR